MTPDDYEDIAFEMNRELGQAERREIDRRVEHARAHCPDHGQTLPCQAHAGDHVAGLHRARAHAECPRCETPPAQIDRQAQAAADDSLDSPNDEGDPR